MDEGNIRPPALNSLWVGGLTANPAGAQSHADGGTLTADEALRIKKKE